MKNDRIDEPYFRGRRNGTSSVTKRHFVGDETALCRRQNVLSSAALVGSPHHFLAQGMEVLRAGTLDDLDTIGSLAKRQTGGVRQGLGATVEGNEIVVGAALDGELYLRVFLEDDGAHVERMGRHGGEREDMGARNDDGTAVGERISRRAGGR